MALVASEGGRWRLLVAALLASISKAEPAVDGHSHESRVKAIDTDFVVRLFAREGPSLVRLARLFTDDRDSAEDIVQEAFIRMQRNAHRIDEVDKAAAYLRSIVLNLSRDHNRRGLMSLRHRMSERRPVTVDRSVEDMIVDTEERREVVEALRDLPLRQRDCLVLRYYFEMTEREVAAALGISQSSVKTHCRRGLAALETRVGES